MDDQLKDKLLKLHELAKRGVGGEKENATTMLARMLDKHGLTLDDIDTNIPKRRRYTFSSGVEEKFILQLISYILQTDKFDSWERKGKRQVIVEVNDYQHIQIIENLDFHLSNFREEKKKMEKDFFNAYIAKHNIYPNLGNPSKATPEELEKSLRAQALVGNLSNKTYTKKLGA